MMFPDDLYWVTVHLYPVHDVFSLRTWLLAKTLPDPPLLFNYCHTSVSLGITDIISGCRTDIEYDYRVGGVHMDANDPRRATYRYTKQITSSEWFDIRGRVLKWREDVERKGVSIWTLRNAVRYPEEVHLDLCTSFVENALYGETTKASNRFDTYIRRIEQYFGIRHLQ